MRLREALLGHPWRLPKEVTYLFDGLPDKSTPRGTRAPASMRHRDDTGRILIRFLISLFLTGGYIGRSKTERDKHPRGRRRPCQALF